ncbi:MAG: HAMP domain-containing protein, partial [Gammaproteobacteria bacterium]|nr:HAMP domain-containing protein [Gammaproteobacteria bacterium]
MRFKIKYQILLIAMIPVFLIDVFFTYFHINSSIKQAEQLLKSKGEIIAQQISGASEFSLQSGNYGQVDHLLKQSIDTNEIIFIAVYDADGKIISTVEGSNYNPEQSTEYSYYRQSIQVQNLNYEDIFQPDLKNEEVQLNHLGWVHMYISKKQLKLHKKQIFNDAAIFFLTMLLIAILLTLSISRRITRPIYTLLHHLKQIETGQLGEIIKGVESNEIGDVQKGFNSMSQSLLANRMQLDQKIKTATLELMNAVTNLEYNNRELAVARDNAQKADQIKTQFLANMSHEIRTPMNAVIGFTDLLNTLITDKKQKLYLESIKSSSKNLLTLINDILDMSKIEAGKLELQYGPVNLQLLFTEIKQIFLLKIDQKKLEFLIEVDNDLPEVLMLSEIRLRQVLFNLIGNSLKFTEKGYVKLSAKKINHDKNENKIDLLISVEDTG